TSPSYAGLYRDAEKARPIPAEKLDALPADWPERAPVADTVQAMTEIDQALDRLEKTGAAGWKAPADHPDLVPNAEAALIAEHFRELARLPESLGKPMDYRKGLKDSEDAAWHLRDQLIADSPATEKLKDGLEMLKANCKICHKAYRDN